MGNNLLIKEDFSPAYWSPAGQVGDFMNALHKDGMLEKTPLTKDQRIFFSVMWV